MHWEALYRAQDVESMPWYYPDLDPDFQKALADAGVEGGKALDLGTGPGTQAMALAGMGFSVTATDISRTAVEKAKIKAAAKGLKVTFLVDDILETRLKTAFDCVFDRGVFHVLDPESRPTYVATIRNLLAPKGRLFLKCFSDKQPGNEGPYRLSPTQIRKQFTPALNVVSISESVFHGTLAGEPKALFVVMRRT